ncbi:MAG: hypothetical protein ACREF9_19670, partial [Opitutaceae bacterium]
SIRIVHARDDFILFLLPLYLSLSSVAWFGRERLREREKRKSQRTVALVAASGRGGKFPGWLVA